MKRFGNLYSKICNIENIKLAHKNASKGKSNYKEVIMVNKAPDYYFNEIKLMLENKTFINGEYKTEKKNDKGKIRDICKLPYFPDRIIHHAIMQILEPIWKKTLINDTYQSIKGRGIHKAKNKIERCIKTNHLPYCLKIDIKKILSFYK